MRNYNKKHSSFYDHIKAKSRIIIGLLSMLFTTSVFAQEGQGSYTSDNSQLIIAAGTYHLVFSENLYVGPNAVWQIDGDVEIFSKNIWISPTAKLSGSGKIIIHNPGDNPFYASWPSQATSIDANNGAFIDVNILLRNNANLALKDMVDPGFSVANLPTGPKAAALRISKNIDFQVDGGDILLNGYHMELASTSQLLNTGAARMIVTNNKPESKLIRQYGGVGEFVFPVGIAEGDFTPARLTPSANVLMYVGVVDYNASLLTYDNKAMGMDRVWNIYGDKAVQSTYTLYHNVITNGNMYVDANARIMQYDGKGGWVGDVTTFVAEGSVSRHTRASLQTISSPLDMGAWYTKLAISGPKAIEDAAQTSFETPVSIDVLLNDQPGSSAIDRTYVLITKQPSRGKVSIDVGQNGVIKGIIYTPEDGYVGIDEFEYEIKDINGLTSKTIVKIDVAARDLMIPNVITPNGDGKNDYFEIVGGEAFGKISLTIVNRWGNEVYRDDDYKNTWNGAGVNEGTYFYIVKTQQGNKDSIYKGWVLLKTN